MNRFSRIKDFYYENKKTYILGIFWLVIVDIIQLILPKILGDMTDAFQTNQINTKSLIFYATLILATGIFSGIARYFWRIYISGNSMKMDYKLRKDLFNHLLSLSPDYFHKHKTGDLMSHATNDITTVRRSLGISIIMFFDSTFIMIIALTMMIRTTNLKLTLIAAINLPIIILLTKNFGNLVYNRSKKVQQSFSTLTEVTQENFSGIRVIKAFAQEDLVFNNFKDINKDNYNKNLSLVKVSGFFNPMLRFVFSLSILLTIYFGGREVILGKISLGEFIAFNSYLGMLAWPTRSIGQIVNNVQRGVASLDRLNEIFDEEPMIKEIDKPKKLINPQGIIEYKNVSFKYPTSTQNILNDINFKVKPGETLAIVGRTGSGKSTIADLLLRLYDINSGEILFDGVNIKNLSLNDLRKNIAYVPQDNFLFSYSIKDNISFAFDKEVPLTKIELAAKQADIYQNIMKFPKTFDTILGERGVTLSGGQQQRTSMARAFIKDSPVLILDDSLSAVDTDTEETILNNLNNMSNYKSNIIISHRISTIKDANEILFLDEGTIKERGTHEELLKNNKSYAQLYQKQLLEENKEENTNDEQKSES